MPQSELIQTFPVPPEESSFLEGTGRRMYRNMWVLGITGAAVFWVWYGWRWAGGFVAGAALSLLNFHLLHRVVASISATLSPEAQAAFPGQRPNVPGAMGSAIRIMLRYALIGAVGYAIFVSSFVSLSAFFIGIFLFVGAALVEAAYELYSALRSA